MNNSFTIKPSLFKEIENNICSLNKDLSSSIGTIKDINFDLLFPYLVDEVPANIKANLSKELFLHRMIYDFYNKKNKPPDDLIHYYESYSDIPIKTFEEYTVLNDRLNKFDSTIQESYLKATERVIYRDNILTKYIHLLPALSVPILDVSKNISAFLLFDDDVCDLEEDVEKNKPTIIIDYLVNYNGSITQAIKEMLALLQSFTVKSHPLLSNFINHFIGIYK